jgi:hypothetical protein
VSTKAQLTLSKQSSKNMEKSLVLWEDKRRNKVQTTSKNKQEKVIINNNKKIAKNLFLNIKTSFQINQTCLDNC